MEHASREAAPKSPKRRRKSKRRKSFLSPAPDLVSPTHTTNSSDFQSNNVSELKPHDFSPLSIVNSSNLNQLPPLVSHGLASDAKCSDSKFSTSSETAARSCLASTLSVRPFSQCEPTASHRTLAALVRAGLVHYVVTQNVDGLHLRSGLPRNRLALLHGDFFVQTCERCGAEVRALMSIKSGIRLQIHVE